MKFSCSGSAVQLVYDVQRNRHYYEVLLQRVRGETSLRFVAKYFQRIRRTEYQGAENQDTRASGSIVSGTQIPRSPASRYPDTLIPVPGNQKNRISGNRGAAYQRIRLDAPGYPAFPVACHLISRYPDILFSQFLDFFKKYGIVAHKWVSTWKCFGNQNSRTSGGRESGY